MELKNYNKRVVVVGNGSSSLTNKNGSFIDDSEIVIRIKSFVTNGFEEYIGNKTDIWFTKWFSFLDEPKSINLWLPFVDPLEIIPNKNLAVINDSMFAKCFSNNKPDLELHKDLANQYNAKMLTINELEDSFTALRAPTAKLVYTKGGLSVMHPTTYFYAIFLSLTRFKDYKIYVTGFDGFTQGYYWNPGQIKKHKKTWPHYYEQEKLYIKKLIYSNRITSI